MSFHTSSNFFFNLQKILTNKKPAPAHLEGRLSTFLIVVICIVTIFVFLLLIRGFIHYRKRRNFYPDDDPRFGNNDVMLE